MIKPVSALATNFAPSLYQRTFNVPNGTTVLKTVAKDANGMQFNVYRFITGMGHKVKTFLNGKGIATIIDK